MREREKQREREIGVRVIAKEGRGVRGASHKAGRGKRVRGD